MNSDKEEKERDRDGVTARDPRLWNKSWTKGGVDDGDVGRRRFGDGEIGGGCDGGGGGRSWRNRVGRH